MTDIQIFNQHGVYIARHDYRDNNPPHFIVHYKMSSRFFHGPGTILKYLNLDESSQLYTDVKAFLAPYNVKLVPKQVVQM